MKSQPAPSALAWRIAARARLASSGSEKALGLAQDGFDLLVRHSDGAERVGQRSELVALEVVGPRSDPRDLADLPEHPAPSLALGDVADEPERAGGRTGGVARQAGACLEPAVVSGASPHPQCAVHLVAAVAHAIQLGVELTAVVRMHACGQGGHPGEHRLLRLISEQLQAAGRQIRGPRAEVEVEQAVGRAPRQLQPPLFGFAHLGRDTLALQLRPGAHRQEIHEAEQVVLAIPRAVVEHGEHADRLLLRVQNAGADVALDPQLVQEHVLGVAIPHTFGEVADPSLQHVGTGRPGQIVREVGDRLAIRPHGDGRDAGRRTPLEPSDEHVAYAEGFRSVSREEGKEFPRGLASLVFHDPAQAVQALRAAGRGGCRDEISIIAAEPERGDPELGEQGRAAARAHADREPDMALTRFGGLGECAAQAARIVRSDEVEEVTPHDVIRRQTEDFGSGPVDRRDAKVRRADERRIRHGVEGAAAGQSVRQGHLRLSSSEIPRAAAMIRVRASLPRVTRRMWGTTLSCGSAANRRNSSG